MAALSAYGRTESLQVPFSGFRILPVGKTTHIPSRLGALWVPVFDATQEALVLPWGRPSNLRVNVRSPFYYPSVPQSEAPGEENTEPSSPEGKRTYGEQEGVYLLAALTCPQGHTGGSVASLPVMETWKGIQHWPDQGFAGLPQAWWRLVGKMRMVEVGLAYSSSSSFQESFAPGLPAFLCEQGQETGVRGKAEEEMRRGRKNQGRMKRVQGGDRRDRR